MSCSPSYFGFFILVAACLIFAGGCRQQTTLFEHIPSSASNIHFNNKVEENDSINPLDLEFLYNGGGVAADDFNNDGLVDLYFTASTTPNKLYLNKGDFRFEDVTGKAGIGGEGRWANAASVVDINNDGWKDIYVSTSILKNPEQRKNILYINQGLNKDGIPVFKDMAAEYNLADTSYSVHAAFFDYDNDNDLDMYLVTTRLAGRRAVQFNDSSPQDGAGQHIDKLFRNDWNDTLRHAVFTEVSKEAGIADIGYGLGVAIVDLNRDGWKDVYVTNDFFSSDHLYINNKNGTFTNRAKEYFKHTSQNAMGNDVADINNDGLADVLAVDMNPEDNFRKKKNMGSNNYFVYQNMLMGEIALQYVRNTLQLNQGPRLNENDSIGEPVFSEVAFLSGLAQTDWSWNACMADFDNDGYRDVLITNGYPRDVTDHDFAAYRGQAGPNASKKELIDQMPQIKVPNYAFRNTGTLQFQNVTSLWGMNQPSFSNGAVYADLDNDGDLDYVINNINEEALVYRNNTNKKDEPPAANYLQMRFSGDRNNRNGLGAIAELHYNGQMQVYENFPYRGYLSTVPDRAHFGLGKTASLDSVVITWPNGNNQVLKNVAANQVLNVDMKDASLPSSPLPALATENLFTEVTSLLGLSYMHQEIDHIDFDKERLLPHKLSQYGPGLAAGDLDGNGLDDLVVGGNNMQEPVLLLQQKGGTFSQKTLPAPQGPDIRRPETLGILLFDADGDGDLDIYFANGSNEYLANTKNYQDRLYVNEGSGRFRLQEEGLPQNHTSKSCVKAADFDRDGDLDLFVGGRVLPGSYPKEVSSFVYRNDGQNGTIRFTDVTQEVAPHLLNIGMVCDALWTDYDNDGWTDLVITGEWMPVTFLKNNKGKLENSTATSGVAAQKGWWNSITGGDFDNDGDMDYIVGNLGQNSFYRASEEHPVSIYAKDYDKNGSFDAITTVYLKDEQQQLKEFTAQNRDDVVSQLPALRKRFATYKDFGRTEFKDMFSKEELAGALHLTANYLHTSLLKNAGNGRFELHPLPLPAQTAPVYGMVADDYNGDGFLDVALVGNDYGTEVSNGQYNALNGLLLLGDGKGGFRPQTILQSGIFVPGDAKALVKFRSAGNNYLLAATQNKGRIKTFRAKQSGSLVNLQPNDEWALLYGKNGQKRKEEFYYGTSFLSQSARFLRVNGDVEKVEIRSADGRTRTVNASTPSK